MSQQDSPKISNVYSEARYAAGQLSKKLNVEIPVSFVYKAKEQTKSNNRQIVYEWVANNLDKL